MSLLLILLLLISLFLLLFYYCLNSNIAVISIYQSYQYPFSRALIGSLNSRCPRLLVDFEAEVKMIGRGRAKNRKGFTLYCFFKNEVHFAPIILINTKTIRGSVYIHRYSPLLWGIVVN